ncbi:hypothetical protein NE237_021943 [Protea cynaroides]|uniref:Uncharacterized protein n=1 Tax=Protea cynaroides TaxID=273540 RepID=A0A9Q0HC74_9MAGN|nr:hypothetical protein NE237_021943 [Protea cynaroides]
MDDNSFFGILPSTIGLYGSLIELFVHGNTFSGAFPIELGNLSDLESLDLSMNNISGCSLPVWEILLDFCTWMLVTTDSYDDSFIAMLGKLLTLDLFSNMLAGPLPLDIGRMTDLALQQKGLFVTEILVTIGNMRKLKHLDVCSCRFTGRFPDEISKLIKKLMENYS